MRKGSMVLVCLLAIPLFLLGCGLTQRTTGTLVINVSTADGKTLQPSLSMTPATYAISGNGPNGSTFTTSSTTNLTEVPGLAPGEWQIGVDANNNGGTQIGHGDATALIRVGTKEAVSVTVGPLSGTGILSLTTTWPAADTQSPEVRASLATDASATPRALAFTIGQAGTATFSASDVPTGYHTLSLQIWDGNTMLVGVVEIVRIIKDQATNGSFTFASTKKPAPGAGGISIDPQMSNPIAVTLSGQQDALVQGSTMTLQASVPAGLSGVSYVWYLDGVQVGTGSSLTLGAGLALGNYRVDVTAYTANRASAGSATHAFSVIAASTKVALAWDANTEADLAGYKVYRGYASGQYQLLADAGNATSYTATGLDPAQTYYFALTAYDVDGNESGYSSEVVVNPL